MVATAEISAQSISCPPIIPEITTVTGVILERERIRAKKNSFQENIKQNNAVATNPGAIRGSAIL